MRVLHVLMAVVYLLAAGPGVAEQRWVEGRVLLIDDDGHVQPPPQAAIVRVHGLDASTTTEPSQGTFRLQLPEGAPISLDVELKGYSVCVPLEMPARPPPGTAAVRVAALLTATDSEAQVACGRRLAAGVVEQVNWLWPAGANPQKLEPAYFIEGWARQHGLSRDLVSKLLAQWRMSGPRQGHEYEQALAAFMAGDLNAAARHAGSAAKQAGLRLRAGAGEKRELISALILQGAVYSSSTEFTLALEAYGHAAQLLTRQESRHLWGSVEYGLGHAHAALSKSQENIREHLECAAQHYRQALTVYMREETPLLWATLQDNLGTAFMRQAWLLEGAAALGLLEQAEGMYRKALEVYTYDQVPAQWTLTQARLGSTLASQGRTLQGEEGMRKLDAAISAQRAALLSCGQSTLAATCSAARHELGEALQALGKRLDGKAGEKHLEEAVEAYQQTLQMYEQMGEHDALAPTRLALGDALIDLGYRVGGERGLRQLKQAEGISRELLKIYTRERQPEEWAKLKYKLALALVLQAEILVDKGTAGLLKDAEGALRDALLVLTHEQHPILWKTIRGALCTVLSQQSVLATGSHPDVELATELEQLCQVDSKGSSEQEPLHAAAIRLSRCVRLGKQAIDTTGEHMIRLWDETVNECQDALRRSPNTRYAAGAQLVLGAALDLKATWARTPDAKISMWQQSASMLRGSLQEYEHDSHPQQWASAKHQLGSVLGKLGIWLGREEGDQHLRESILVLQELLAAITYESSPDTWIAAQSALCFSQQWLGARVEDREAGSRLLETAVTTCEETLKVLKPDSHPEEWSQLKSNLYYAQRKALERSTITQIAPTVQQMQAQDRGVTPPNPRRQQTSGEFLFKGGRWLSGHVVLVDERGGERQPAQSVTVRITSFGTETMTSPGNGLFRLPLPETVMPGDPVVLNVLLEGYELSQPQSGKTQVPHEQETLKVILKPSGARQALQRQETSRLSSWWFEQAKREMLDERGTRAGSPGEEGNELGYEQKLIGSEIFDGRERRLALDAFAKRKYEETIMHLRRSMSRRDELLHKAEASNDRFTLQEVKTQVIKDLLLLGDAYLQRADWENASKAGKTALVYAQEVQNAHAWALANALLARVHMGMVLVVSPSDAFSGLSHARKELLVSLDYLNQGLKVFVRTRTPYNWASLQLDRGMVLLFLALMDQDNDSAMQSLEESAAIHQEALAVFAEEHLTFACLLTKISLGQVYVVLGREAKGKAGLEYSKRAIAALEGVLKEVTRESSPELWAVAQAHLGMAFYNLGSKVRDRHERVQWLVQAESAFTQALIFINQGSSPRDWAGVQLNLTLVYAQLSLLETSEKSAQLRQRAVGSCQQALGAMSLEGWTFICESPEMIAVLANMYL